MVWAEKHLPGEERCPWPQHKQARLVCHELRYVNTFSPDTKGQGHRRPSVMSLPEYLAVLFINQLPADVVFFNTNSPSRALCMRSNCKCLYCFFPPLIYCSIDIYMGAQCGALLFSLLIIFTLWLLIWEDKLFTVDLLRSGLFYNETVLGKWVPSESEGHENLVSYLHEPKHNFPSPFLLKAAYGGKIGSQRFRSNNSGWGYCTMLELWY